jgi:hypothetical protein
MKYKIVIVLIILLITGCAFHSEPEGNLEFHQISQLAELAGTYKNKGNPSGYLSWILWKEVISGHEDIEFIEVVPKNNSLIVRAIRKGCSIYDRTYILGRDFKISYGKIIIHREAHLLTRGFDDVLLGPSYQDITLGLDAGRNGKSRSSRYAAGLVFMMFPIAFSDTSDIRYERISDKPQEFKDCKSLLEWREERERREGRRD